MKTVGLTGGIGSGKSTVASMFKSLGVPTYNADTEAKVLMQNSEALQAGLKTLFGDEAFKNNVLNRTYISKKIFSDQSLLKQMNALVHPAVAAHYNLWLSEQTAPYIIKEVAILFEIGAQNEFDFILTVTAPKQTRIDRVVNRDTKSATEIEAIMANQWSENYKIKHSDFIIENIELLKTRKQVYAIHNKILKRIS